MQLVSVFNTKYLASSILFLLLFFVSACLAESSQEATGDSPLAVRVGVFDVPLNKKHLNVPIREEMKSYLSYGNNEILETGFHFADEDSSSSFGDHALRVSFALHRIYEGPISFFPVPIAGSIEVVDSEKAAQYFIKSVQEALKKEIRIFNFSMGILASVWTELSATQIYNEGLKYDDSKYKKALQAPPVRKSIRDLLIQMDQMGATIVMSLGNGAGEFGAELKSNLKLSLVKQFPNMFILVGEYSFIDYLNKKMPLGDIVSQDVNDEIGSSIIFAETPIDYFGQKVGGSSVAAPQVTGAIAKLCDAYSHLAPREAAKIVLQSADFKEPEMLKGKGYFLGQGVLNVKKAREAVTTSGYSQR